ncbi:MAG: hypothetical protein JNN20_18895 [Betaproteobacteria bacterium]|nr:hypothetical protein [Betaproteobacteria bacterium]
MYDVPPELKIYIFVRFAVASLALSGFVWYSNRQAKQKDMADPKQMKKMIKQKRHDRSR